MVQIFIFNAVPAVGVIFLKWDAKRLILAFFLETIIALLFHAVRMWYVNMRWGNEPETQRQAAEMRKMNQHQDMPPTFLPLVMLAVFGVFCFVQLMILGGFAEKAFPEGIFTHLCKAATGELRWVVGTFVLLQVLSFTKEIVVGQYAFTPAEMLFFQPFRRILVQQLTVILGGFFILFGTEYYVFVMVLVNLALDLFFYFINNAKLKMAVTNGNPEAEKSYEELKRMM